MPCHPLFPPRRRGLGPGRELRREFAVTGLAFLVFQTQPPGRRTRRRTELLVTRLHEIDQAPVVAEILLGQFRVAIEAEARDHQSLEVTHQEIRQVERAGFLVGERLEGLRAGEELVAVRARQSLDAFLRDDRIEQAARAAIGLGDVDLLVGATARADGVADGVRDLLGTVVQLRRQALHVEGRPAVRPLQRDDLAGEGAAGDDQDGRRARHRSDQWAAARRAAISALAVSTATAASRQ